MLLILALAIQLAECRSLSLGFALCFSLPLTFPFICTFAGDLEAVKRGFIRLAVIFCISCISHSQNIWEWLSGKVLWGEGKCFCLLEGHSCPLSQAGRDKTNNGQTGEQLFCVN